MLFAVGGAEGKGVDAVEVSSLVAELFAAIHMLSPYAVPEQAPEVHFVPLATMQRMICKDACAVKAFYLPDKGIYVDETADVRSDVFARSILLHELVHHLQHLNGRFAALDTHCQRWQAKEIEAYQIQHRYLSKMNATRSFIALDTLPILCRDDTPSVSTLTEPAAAPAAAGSASSP